MCSVKHNAKQAITLNSASSKFRNDIIEVIKATYRLKGKLLGSGNKVAIAHFETSKFRWHGSDRYQRSFSVCYPPILGVWFYCFTNGTPCFLRVHFLIHFGGSPFLVLLGGRLTVLGNNLEKYDSSEKMSTGRQHEKSKLFWSPTDNYQLWNRKLQKFQLSSEILKSLQIENFRKLQMSSNFEHSYSDTDPTILNYSKNIRKIILLWRKTNKSHQQQLF